MKAVVLEDVKKIRWMEVDEPKLVHPTDAIIEVTLTSICGTDLHAYRKGGRGFPKFNVMGHEFMGIVVEIGEQVKDVSVGDRVVVSDIVACGKCQQCMKNKHYHCKHASLFGYGEIVGNYTPGGQAERVRIPYADHVLIKIPDSLRDEQALFIGDILSTGYACAEKADIQEGDCVVVIGGGPVGIMAAMCAQLYKPCDIFVIEPCLERHVVAKRCGFTPITPNQLAVIIDATGGEGANVILDAVGKAETINQALTLLCGEGSIVCVGSPQVESIPFAAVTAFAKEATLSFVVGNPMKYGDLLLKLIAEGTLSPELIITHHYKLEDADKAYREFDSRIAMKVVMKP